MQITFDVPDFTTVAAWIGAITGIAAVVWQVATWRRSAHNVKVQRTLSWLTYTDGSLSPDLVCVEAKNVGAAAVTVTNWGISLGRNKENLTVLQPLAGSTPLPHRLESGAQMSLFVQADDVRRARHERAVPFAQMSAWVGLATGKKVNAKRGIPMRD